MNLCITEKLHKPAKPQYLYHRKTPQTCKTTISKKKRFAARWNCSYRLRGKKVRGVYL